MGCKRRLSASGLDRGNCDMPQATAAGDVGVRTRAAARKLEGTTKDAPAAQPNAAGKPVQLVAVPRTTRSQAVQSQRAQGPSLSSLLSQRSEAFVNSVNVRAPPPSPLPDIDSGDKLNPLMAADYVNDIYYFYKRVEPQFKVPSDYMTKQVSKEDRQRQSRAKGGLPFATLRSPTRTISTTLLLFHPFVCRPTSTRRCALSSSTGSWRCT